MFLRLRSTLLARILDVRRPGVIKDLEARQMGDRPSERLQTYRKASQYLDTQSLLVPQATDTLSDGNLLLEKREKERRARPPTTARTAAVRTRRAQSNRH